MNAPETTKQAAYALAGIYLCEEAAAVRVPTQADAAVGAEPPAGEPEPVTPPG